MTAAEHSSIKKKKKKKEKKKKLLCLHSIWLSSGNNRYNRVSVLDQLIAANALCLVQWPRHASHRSACAVFWAAHRVFVSSAVCLALYCKLQTH